LLLNRSKKIIKPRAAALVILYNSAHLRSAASVCVDIQGIFINKRTLKPVLSICKIGDDLINVNLLVFMNIMNCIYRYSLHGEMGFKSFYATVHEETGYIKKVIIAS